MLTFLELNEPQGAGSGGAIWMPGPLSQNRPRRFMVMGGAGFFQSLPIFPVGSTDIQNKLLTTEVGSKCRCRLTTLCSGVFLPGKSILIIFSLPPSHTCPASDQRARDGGECSPHRCLLRLQGTLEKPVQVERLGTGFTSNFKVVH